MPRGTIGRQAARSEVATAGVLEAALELFSTQGYGATSMRQIAEACDQSVGNLYHHFGSKEKIYQNLIDDYWARLLDPEHPLQKVFSRANFPDDLEDLAARDRGDGRGEQGVDPARLRRRHRAPGPPHPLLLRDHGGPLQGEVRPALRGARDARAGSPTPIPLVAVMVATRWLFYFYTVEKCFGVPMHFGMDAQQAVDGFIRILRNGVLRRRCHARRHQEHRHRRRKS